VSYTQRLPAELREFLALPGPQSLLVRGPPGSGKTTLSLALLEAAAGHRMLLTSRVSQAELYRGFPWLGENGGSHIQIVDTSVIEANLRDIARAATEATRMLDGAPGEKREATDFLWLPSPVQEAWSHLPRDSPSIVVIDSWDALIESYLGGIGPKNEGLPDRAELERILLRQLGRSRAHTVIVLERREESQLDYLVNGVIVTQREMGNERLERWLQLPKLRGIRIANAFYPYTVEAARFQCIEPMRTYSELQRGRLEPEPDAMPGHIWPGSRVFAENFGRLPVGKSSLFETDVEVQDQVLQLLLAPVLASVANSGGRALLIPSPSLSAREIWDSLRGTAAKSKLEHGVRVLDAGGQLEEAAKGSLSDFASLVMPLKGLLPSVSPAKGGTPGAPVDSEVRRFIASAGTAGAPVVVVVFTSGFGMLASALRTPLTTDQLDSFPALAQVMLGTTPSHLAIAGRTGAPLVESVRSLAALHVHLRVRQGRVFVYGSKPWTSGLVLTEGTETSPYDLLRIV
jgi:KaiC/GvpD/RAD55 family RecA-like ATPase